MLKKKPKSRLRQKFFKNKKFKYLIINLYFMNNKDLESKRTKCEVYSRVVGWIVPVQQWNEGKKSEFIDRQTFDKQLTGPGCGCGE